MTTPSDTPSKEDIARVAFAIWEAEGRPEGCDHEHWMRARQVIEEGRAEIEFSESTAAGDQDNRSPRPVQPGFEDAAPGMVPGMKANPGPELREEPGRGLAKQLAEAPAGGAEDASSGQVETPGQWNPAPESPTNAAGYVAIRASRTPRDAPLPTTPSIVRQQAKRDPRV